ncbi:sce7725 family protein [Levilactobacillus brevis]|uniref:sce7725 family protein n=1 Tax=Levilactobacillus brevis TaxID=1580 RepID=UPI003D16F0BA
MYFPFLRGKQNELLALRELLDQGKLSEKIVPIIEPVKKSATFRILLEQFDIAGRQIAVVQNSTLSNYMGFDSEEISRIKKTSNFIPAYFLPASESRRREPNQKSMEIIASNSSFSDFDSLKDSHDYVVVHEDNRRAILSLKTLDGISPIELDQGLHKKERNVDYAEEPDEFFLRNINFMRKRSM